MDHSATAKELRRPGASFSRRYGLAFASVAGALLLDLLFHRFNLPHPFAAFALSVIAITFWYGGTKPGIVAVLLSSLIRGFIVEGKTNSLSRVLYELVFLTFAILMIWVRRRKEALEVAIVDRTAKLTAANDDLHRRKEQLNGLFELSPDAVILTDEDFHVLRINKQFTRIFGYTAEEVAGQWLPDLIVPEELRAEALNNRTLLTSGNRVELEAIRQRKDGLRLDVSVVARGISLGFDQVAYLIYRDITERKKAERKLERSEANLLESQRLMHICSWAYDPSSATVTFSPEVMSIPRLPRTNADMEKRKDAAEAGNRHVALLYWQPRRLIKMIGISLIVVSLGACDHPAKEPATLTFLDPEWSHDLTERNVLPDERLQEFTRQTGIRVKHLPAPETALDQLGMAQELLRKGSSSPDVSGVDVIWPGTLSEDLIDLKPYFVKELSSVDPDVVASYTVKGKLVAVPYVADIGVLFYRKDLLREYGYGTPPRTWDQLEKMAARIQLGERAKGQKDFWGFVWPGAAGEGLTCNALEWQVAEGGGRIIEDDSTISVNNPDAIRSWQRAAHWIGRISSPSVISYEEWDAINAFYLGKAAFYRGWARSYFLSVEDKCGPASTSRRICGPAVRDRIGISSVPDGKAAQVSALGGFGLGVSRSAAHPAEALELVRFLIRREMQFEAVRAHSESPLEQLEWPAFLKATSDSADIGQHQLGSGLVSRPSTVSGQKYVDVAHAYIRAVHSVLMGKTSAPQAAAGLEKELVGITSFRTGPPSRIRGPKD